MLSIHTIHTHEYVSNFKRSSLIYSYFLKCYSPLLSTLVRLPHLLPFQFTEHLNEAQAGIMIAKRSSNNNLRHADGTTLKTEGEEELKSLLMKMKEDGENVG